MTPEKDAGKVRVLLVDDEPDFLEAIGYWLEAKGYHVSKAVSGEQALHTLRTEEIDVMFLDVMMPKMDGIETLRRIRSFNKLIPVILVTASSLTDEDKYAGARALGVAGVFPKGTDLGQLAQVLQVALRRIRSKKPGVVSAIGAGSASVIDRLRDGWRSLRTKLFPPPKAK